MNINTETGRLSSRRPNLQNQPALEKDRYNVRKCFAATGASCVCVCYAIALVRGAISTNIIRTLASEGNVLIVADYGQLELRLLAHMARCVRVCVRV
jgi:DNA polymerase-1